MESINGILAPDLIGVLDRDLTVEVVEISRSGCLLESSSAIPVGTVAALTVEINGAVYTDDVRVARCEALPGAGERHYVGVAFLPLRRPGKQSLRLYAAALASGSIGPMRS
jgi:hypothetical protein